MNAYPIDGFYRTGIKRLLYLQKVVNGEKTGTIPPKGALLPTDSIGLKLSDHDFLEFPSGDPVLQKQLDKLFPNMHESYSITVLDYSDPDNIRYAKRVETKGFQPGSVGKLAVLTALFCELENIYPYDFDKRIALLKDKKVRAGVWAIPNIHNVPVYNETKETLTKRLLVESDVFSLYEWLDHMLSVSSNGAASVVWREIMLMRAFGEEYVNLDQQAVDSYFKSKSRKELSDLSIDVVNSPLRELGIEEDDWRLGTFFTRGASNIVTPQGGSIATPRALTKWLWLLEHGQIVDTASSLEMKRLMYLTDTRIRYASNARLKEAALFFKSGSLYKCKEEEGFSCGKYMGNVFNYMNSVCIVEHLDGTHYFVVLMTNVLKKNSNIDHNVLAGNIDKLIRN